MYCCFYRVDKAKALSLMLHAADISHPAKAWKLHYRWTQALMEEFFRQVQYKQSLTDTMREGNLTTVLCMYHESLRIWDTIPIALGMSSLGSTGYVTLSIMGIVVNHVKLYSRAAPAILQWYGYKGWYCCCFLQGDKEVELGLPFSPLCDRKATMIAQSQIGEHHTLLTPCELFHTALKGSCTQTGHSSNAPPCGHLRNDLIFFPCYDKAWESSRSVIINYICCNITHCFFSPVSLKSTIISFSVCLSGFIDFIVEPTFSVLVDTTEKIITPLIEDSLKSHDTGVRRSRWDTFPLL